MIPPIPVLCCLTLILVSCCSPISADLNINLTNQAECKFSNTFFLRQVFMFIVNLKKLVLILVTSCLFPVIAETVTNNSKLIFDQFAMVCNETSFRSIPNINTTWIAICASSHNSSTAFACGAAVRNLILE